MKEVLILDDNPVLLDYNSKINHAIALKARITILIIQNATINIVEWIFANNRYCIGYKQIRGFIGFEFY